MDQAGAHSEGGGCESCGDETGGGGTESCERGACTASCAPAVLSDAGFAVAGEAVRAVRPRTVPSRGRALALDPYPPKFRRV